MANYENLKKAISDVIKKNGKQLITGEILQSVLLQMVNIIGENATFAGIADTQTQPGTPDQNVFYMAFAAGDYPNFDGIKLPIDSIAIFENSTGEWVSHVYTFAAGKIDKTDIADNLTTNNSEKVLSAKQGVSIKNLIDALQKSVATNTQSIKNNSTAITQQGNAIQSQQQTITQHGNDIASQASQISAQGGKLSTIESAVSSIENELTRQGETISTQGRTIEEQGRAIISQSSDIQSLKTGKQNTLVSGENIKSINGESVVGSGNVVINPTIMDLKWTTNVVTTRKLVPTELRAKDVRIAYTNNSGVYIVEKYTAEAIDDTSWANSANWKGCRTPLTSIVEKYGVVFNDDTGYYEYNTLKDLTEEDIMVSYIMTGNIKQSGYLTADYDISTFGGLRTFQIRTNLANTLMYKNFNNIKLSGQGFLEVFTFESVGGRFNGAQPFKIKGTIDAYYSVNKLKKFIGILDVSACSSDFAGYYKFKVLEELFIKGVKVSNTAFSETPYINYASVKYEVDNASNTKAITITVHPTTYGYLTGTIEPTEQVGGTTEEWQQIVTDAAEKQISFATE